MNINLKFIIFILSLSLLSACTKENKDLEEMEIEEQVAEVISCDLTMEIIFTNDETLAVDISGGTIPFVYEWSTGETTEQILISQDGVYELTLTDSEGCTAISSIDVDSETPCNGLIASIETDETGFILTANNEGGIPPFVYGWSNGATTQTITINEEGTYTVIVFDSEVCSSSAEITVGNLDPCNGLILGVENVSGSTFSAGVFGGNPPFAYEWSTGETTETISISDEGTYSVTIVDVVGCLASSEFVVGNDPCNSLFVTVSTNGNNATALVTGGTAPYSYSWPNGGTDSVLTGLAPGNYEITIVDAEGCTASAIFVIISNINCDMSDLEFVFDFDSMNLTLTAEPIGGVAPYSYWWSNQQVSTTEISVESGNTYTLVLEDANGCSVAASFDVP